MKTGTKISDAGHTSRWDSIVAYHEAGHVVAASCLGIKVRRASIVGDGKLGGYTEIEREKPSTYAVIDRGDLWHRSRFRAEKLVMVTQAGEVAQLIYDPGSISIDQCLVDMDATVRVLVNYTKHQAKPDVKPYERLLYGWTEALIAQNWNLVEAIADALLDRRKLSGTEIRKVILSSTSRKQLSINVGELWDAVAAIKKRDRGD